MSIYKEGMLVKHFKGETLLEKNIYEIKALGVNGSNVDFSLITYTGDNNALTATNLVVYANIFQDNKLFAREYEDISSPLSEEKKLMYHQNLKVEPLTQEEIKLVKDPGFISKKNEYTASKFKTR